jgi:mRNA interferase RelE/StbE
VPYQISYSDEARQALRILPGNYRQRIRRMIESLDTVPRPIRAKALRDLPEHYRIRMDRWRIIYRVNDEDLTVLILRISLKEGPGTYQDIA